MLLPTAAAVLMFAQGASLTGKWDVHLNVGGTDRDQTCTFTQKDNDLTGTCDTDNGAVQIAGKVDGKKVTWAFKSAYNGSPLTVTFRGSIDSPTKISGPVIVEEMGIEGSFTATPSK